MTEAASAHTPVLDRPPEPARRPPGPTAKPAAIVLAAILVVFLAGFFDDLVTSGHHGAPPSPASVARAVPGTGGLVPEASAAVLSPVVSADEPPANIVAALVVPKGTQDVPRSGVQQGVGLYDASIDVEVPAAETDVITFLRKELKAGDWTIDSTGPASDSTYRFIAEHPGSDGNEWELGCTLSPTAFSSTVPGMTVPRSGVTPLTLRLFAISDDS